MYLEIQGSNTSQGTMGISAKSPHIRSFAFLEVLQKYSLPTRCQWACYSLYQAKLAQELDTTE